MLIYLTGQGLRATPLEPCETVDPPTGWGVQAQRGQIPTRRGDGHFSTAWFYKDGILTGLIFPLIQYAYAVIILKHLVHGLP